LGERLPAVGSAAAEYKYYAADVLRSTRFTVQGSSGAVGTEYAYEAYGKLLGTEPATGSAYLYAGEQWDGDVQAYYLRARWYLPAIGRFTSRDTYDGRLEDPISRNKYLYCHADPVNRVDPSGKMSTIEALSVIGGQFRIAQTVAQLGRAIKAAGTAIDTINFVRELAQFFIDPASLGLQNALHQLQGTTTDPTFAKFFTPDGIREALSTLGANAQRIGKVLATRPGVLSNFARILAKPSSDVVLFMPTPAVNTGLRLPPMKTPVKFRGHNVILFFGKAKSTKSDPLGHTVVGGRVLGLGLQESSASLPEQVFRMDWHPRHLSASGTPTYDFHDGDYHFHVAK
jgi:RHS repeat-associated protein